ncbi:MAG: riboflavin synthase [Planctomycetota bacterium]
MFTGIIEAAVPVLAFEPAGEGARLVLARPAEGPEGPFEAALGDSIAVSGCCLTVAELPADGSLVFDLSAETLQRTWFQALAPGRRVNLERSVRLSDRLGGHMVSGHVDGGGTITAIHDAGDGGRVFTFEVDPGLERYLIEKGSVGLDGISLTVVEPRDRSFDVALIPLTLEITSLGQAEVGQRINVEADAIGKWVEKLLVDAGRI